MPRPAVDPKASALTKELRRRAGQWLKGVREAAGLTQAELAERVGMRYYTFVSQIESGVGRVPVEQQAAWAEALGIPAPEFARTLLRHYEPELHRLLFEEAAPKAARA